MCGIVADNLGHGQTAYAVIRLLSRIQQSEAFDVAKIISQRTVESAKPPKEGRATRADGIVPGMQFITHAGGKKSFRLLARIHGKQVNLEIGDAAILSLADARAKAKGLLGAIAHGEDPRETKRAAVRTAAKTVEVVAAEFIERYAKVHNKPRTWARPSG